MKLYILLFIFLSSVYGFAQNCDFVVNEIDEFKKIEKKYLEKVKIGRSNVAHFFFQLRKLDKQKLLFVEYGYEISCINNDSYIMIKLKNQEVLKIYNSGGVDCGRVNPYYFILDEDFINKLSKSEIEKLRIYGKNGYSESVKIKKPKFFIENLECLN